MKNLFLALLLLPLGVFAQKPFSINGKITDLPNGSSVKLTSTENNQVIASSTVKDGSFSIKGEVEEPSLFLLTIGDAEPSHLFVEPGTTTVSGSKSQYRISGSRSHKDFEDFQATFTPLVGKMNIIANEINQTGNEAKRAALMADYAQQQEVIKNEVGRFIETRKSSHVSPFLLYVTAQLYDDPVLLEKRFLMLDESIRSSSMGQGLAQFIADSKIGAVGTPAVEFVQNDVNGNPVSLSSFRGKYVLVDFWASWCKPCRDENPAVVRAFKKFNNKNFTVLGVSLDRDRDPWLKAIDKDGLTWTQVSDLKFWNNEAARLYKVTGIPQNFLIDPNGTIVARNLRGQDLENKLCELLGCN